MKRSLPAALLAALALLAYMPQGSAGEEPAELLPNLRPRRAQDVALHRNDGVKKIRFTTNVANNGQGPLELRPRRTGCGGDAENYVARQYSYLDVNGSGVFERNTDVDTTHRRVGCFTFHAAHDHWHFMDFADYALFKVKADGTLRSDPVATSNKVSFCMMDSFPSNKDLPGKPESGVYESYESGNGCRATKRSGISVGWEDYYPAYLPGQALNVTGLKPGPYCLSVSLDPSDRLYELSNDDNRRLTWLRLWNNDVRVRYQKVCPS
jgi:hypothetical protein